MQVGHFNGKEVKHQQDGEIRDRVKKRFTTAFEVIPDGKARAKEQLLHIKEKTMVHMKDGMGNIMQQGSEMYPVLPVFLTAMRAIFFFNVLPAVPAGADGSRVVHKLVGHALLVVWVHRFMDQK